MEKDKNINKKLDNKLNEQNKAKEPLDEKELSKVTAGTDVLTIVKTIKDIVTK